MVPMHMCVGRPTFQAIRHTSLSRRVFYLSIQTSIRGFPPSRVMLGTSAAIAIKRWFWRCGFIANHIPTGRWCYPPRLDSCQTMVEVITWLGDEGPGFPWVSISINMRPSAWTWIPRVPNSVELCDPELAQVDMKPNLDVFFKCSFGLMCIIHGCNFGINFGI